MNKEDSIDSNKLYSKQKQIDDMREYTKEYGREQFVKLIVEQQEEFAKLQQENKELKEKIRKDNFKHTYSKIVHNAFQTEKSEKKYYENILNELKKWIEKELKIVYRDCGHKHNTLLEVYHKIEEMEYGENGINIEK